MKKDLKRIFFEKTALYPLQAKVKKELYDQANAIRKKHGLSWREVMDTCMSQFIQGMKK